PDLNSQKLEIGKVYKIKAQPDAGSIFVGWQGAGLALTNDPTLTFQMMSQLTNLVAIFTNNLFLDAAGSYAGLFFSSDPTQISTDTSGFVNLRVDQFGAFSGKVIMNGRNFPCRAIFDAFGNAQFPVARKGQRPIVCSLKLDFPQQRILGFVTNALDADLVAVPLRM